MKISIRSAAFGAITALAVAGAVVATTDCSPAQVAQAIDLTNAACAVAEGQPAGQPYVDVVCILAQTGETIAVDLGALGGDAGTTLAKVPLRAVTVRIPAPQAPAFLAAHSAKH